MMEQERYVFAKVSEPADRIYNLSFGDSDESGNNIDDEVISNNADGQKPVIPDEA